MARPSFNVKSQYIGAGNLASYTFDFKVTNLEHLLIVVEDDTNTEVQRVRGSDTTYLSSVVLDPYANNNTGGGTVNLQAFLPTNYTLIILLANDEPSQTFQFRNQMDFTMARIEAALDAVVGMIQRIAYKANRSVKLNDADDETDWDPTLPPNMPNALGLLPVTSDDPLNPGWAPLIKWPSLKALTAGNGGNGLLTLPTDGVFGNPPGGGVNGTAGIVTGIDAGMTISDAMDLQEQIFQLLVPVKPPLLSAITMTIAGAYTALQAVTGTLFTGTVIDSVNPTLLASPGFMDGKQGTLSATMDATAQGSVTLTSGDDTGLTSGWLTVLSDVDPYLAMTGAGFYKVITARIAALTLAVGSHIATMVHSLTGTSSLTFGVDNPVTPSIDATGRSVTPSGATSTFSGVPGYTTGAQLLVGFIVDNAVSAFYNSTRIAAASVPEGNGVNATLPGTPPTSGAQVTASIALTLATNKYNETLTPVAIGYNSKGITGNANLATAIRIDSMSSETNRVLAGAGQFPTKGASAGQWSGAWVAATSLATNKEAQMLAGLYQYPPLVNYSTKLPVGPDYSGLTSDTTYNNVRWVMIFLGVASNATSWTFNMNGAQNFGATALISGIYMQLIVDGATGFLDANAAYPGTGSPVANGDPALDVSGSTATSRRITFGPTPRSGNVYARVAILTGSTKKFGSIT